MYSVVAILCENRLMGLTSQIRWLIKLKLQSIRRWNWHVALA